MSFRWGIKNKKGVTLVLGGGCHHVHNRHTEKKHHLLGKYTHRAGKFLDLDFADWYFFLYISLMFWGVRNIPLMHAFDMEPLFAMVRE